MIPLLQTARELLQMQPTLHPKIFSADERLLPDVRQKIMEAADFMIRQGQPLLRSQSCRHRHCRFGGRLYVS